MARPKLKADAVATTERLLDAAEAEFGAKGFDRTRLQDIAKRVGISRPSLLYHFESKQVLYAAVVHKAFASLGEALLGAFANKSTFAERIDRIVGLFNEFLESHPAMASLILRELVDGRGPGREMLLEAGVPVLDQVEAFAKGEGRVEVRGVPVRVALMQLVAGTLLRATAGPLLEPLWGDDKDYSRAIARVLFVEE